MLQPASRVAAVVLALLAAALLGAAPAAAASTAPQVHHVFPEDGAVLAAPPDHVEVMFDVLLQPGRVDVAVAADGADRPVALTARPVLDGPLLVEELPPLAPGHYTVGVRLLGDDGHVFGGTFGFTVDPATTSPAPAPAGGGARWLVPVVAAALLVPAAAAVVLRRRRALTPRRPAPGAGPGAPARAAGRTPTSASSPAAPRDR